MVSNISEDFEIISTLFQIRQTIFLLPFPFNIIVLSSVVTQNTAMVWAINLYFNVGNIFCKLKNKIKTFIYHHVPHCKITRNEDRSR